MEITIPPRNNFELLEKEIPYKIVQIDGNTKTYVLVSMFKEADKPFGQYILMPINEKLAPDYEGNELYEFITEVDLENIEEWQSNHEDVVIGEDIIILGDEEIDSMVDVNIKDIENICYFIFRNKLSDPSRFEKSELDALNQTFFKIIAKYSEKYDNVTTPNDLLYKYVIDFYANGQYDDATILMKTIFDTELPTGTSSSTCGCNTQSSCASSTSSTTPTINTGTSIVNLDTATCEEKYRASMYQWLLKMLSDINFYCDWMFLYLNDGGPIDKLPNDALLNSLIQLLTEFLELGYDLSDLSGTGKRTCCNCGHTARYNGKIYKNDNGNRSNGANGSNKGCPDIYSDYSDSSLASMCENYSIIKNYIKVLNWVKNNEIDENKNKIYIYGKKFAEILPLLNF